MRRLSGASGVIPVVEVDGSAQPTWFVMAKATPLAAHLGSEPDLRAVVEAMATVAGTLAGVAATYGIAHRDIKPDNLLWLDGPVVADFGIAEVPNRSGLTRIGEKVGPHEFLAPEMREVAEGVDGFAADVWAIAKTLFVLAGTSTDKWPPVGTLMAGRPEFSLFRAGGDAAYMLEPLLESATAYLPRLRPSMTVVARELAAWGGGLSEEAGRRPALPSTVTGRISFTRESLHPEAALWARRNRVIHRSIWRMMVALVPGCLVEDGALGLFLESHDHDAESHFDVNGLATTVSTGGMRIVVAGFLLPDGSTTQYFAEIQQEQAGASGQFALVRSLSTEGAAEWPTGQRAVSDMHEMLMDALAGHVFPKALEQVAPLWD